jgi:hypothetical protein
MHRRVFLILISLVVIATGAARAAGVLLICNKSDDTISFVDTKTFDVLGTTTTGRGPHEVRSIPIASRTG